MKQELQQKLYKKYPELFGQRKLSQMQSAMFWGIETGDGWYDIIDNMCLLIQSHIENEREERARNLVYNRALARAVAGNTRDLNYFYRKLYKNEEVLQKRVDEDIKSNSPRPVRPAFPQIEFTQIKEKFGGLRVYTNYSSDYIYGVIRMADAMSYKICETCGKPGKRRGNSWMYISCDEHTREQDKNEQEEDE